MATVPELKAVRAQAFTFYLPLASQANPNVFQTNPTLAAGDLTISIDGGGFAPITTPPDVFPLGGKQVRVRASGAEMNGAWVGFLFSDVLGNEWQDIYIGIETELAQAGDVAETGADADTLETLSDQIDGVCTLGAGAFTWTYTLTSAVFPFGPIADADIWVTTDIGGLNVIASDRTDAFGVVTFYLDAGPIFVWRQKSGWNFVNPDLEIVP